MPADNPHYEAASRVYGANQAQCRSEHVMESQAVASTPAPGRLALPQDMRASSVPAAVQMQATRLSPGETR